MVTRRSERTEAMRIHYAGALKYVTSDGYTREILPGWAACCSGDKAKAIRERRMHTYMRAVVTCMACLRVLAAADRGAVAVGAQSE